MLKYTDSSIKTRGIKSYTLIPLILRISTKLFKKLVQDWYKTLKLVQFLSLSTTSLPLEYGHLP